MAKGSSWKKSVKQMLTDELEKYWWCLNELRNWGMWQYEYGDLERVNWIQSFLQDELINRKLWDFSTRQPKNHPTI